MISSEQPTRVLGIPLGDFGLLPSLFFGVASGFLAFFASCFLAIMSLLVWNTATHAGINYADAYRDVALPVGVVAMAAGLIFFTGLWLRRKFSGGH